MNVGERFTVVTPSAPPPDELLRPVEVARRTGYAESTLAVFRVRGGGPPYRKVRRAVLYAWPDVLAWLGDPRSSTTTAPPAPAPQSAA